MTREQVRLVQSTWVKMLPIKDFAAQLFYTRLFELDPLLRELFHSDLGAQQAKLMQVMDAVVNRLGELEQLLPMVRQLGRRHVEYGVKDGHYDTVAAALLWTLSQGLGADFTDNVRDAWAVAYDTLSRVMREAAADSRSK